MASNSKTARQSKLEYRARVRVTTEVGGRTFVTGGVQHLSDVSPNKAIVAAIQWVGQVEAMIGRKITKTARLVVETETIHTATIEVETTTRKTDRELTLQIGRYGEITTKDRNNS